MSDTTTLVFAIAVAVCLVAIRAMLLILDKRLRALELADRERRAMASLFDAMRADASGREAARN